MFTYYIIYPLCWLLSLLPYKILYLKSDFLYVIIYYLIRYRRKVVFDNLRNSFPEKSNNEIKKIAKGFYKNFCDRLVEFIKMIHLSYKELDKRYVHKNIELLDEYYRRKRSIILIAGHYCNWETSYISLSTKVKQKCFAVYQPLSNKYFDRLVNRLRSQTGTIMIPLKQTYKTMLKYRDEPTINAFVADQSPPKNEIEYWTNFLSQDTAVFTGPEKIARKLDFAVVFSKSKMLKRGYFEIEHVKICDSPDNTNDFEITEKYTRLLEGMIKEDPENWLWSHRRWKHKITNYK